MTTKITEQNISNLANIGVQWQSVFTGDGSTGLTAVAGRGYFIDTTSGTVTITLPASPSAGDVVVLKDYARTWGTNNVTLASALMDGGTAQKTFDTQGATVTLVYMDNTKGWTLINEDTTSQLIITPTFISATGGTVTTSGDYKIHTFTGDGCFVVSTTGNAPATPTGGPSTVDYLVVAGGGGSGHLCSGGGGGGGFRVSNSDGLPAPTMSPLSNPTGIPVSATTYPITVGGGGAGGPYVPGGVSKGVQGSSSIFSTITSAGGGYGASGHNIGGNPGNDEGGAGGSGGGGMGANPINPGPSDPSSTGLGGNGNTPPVSPPQGNPGGAGVDGYASYHASAGGGGAGAAGTNSPSHNQPPGPARYAGPGGVGSYVSPSFAVGCAGTPGPVCGVRYFAGGGGGGTDAACGAAGTGGAGGGGNAAGPSAGLGTAGTSNTGGGAGGSSSGSNPGAAGGKGIVILRYKFQ